MDKIIAQFTNQIRDAIEIGKKNVVSENVNFSNILACGLGGSGIGAKISKSLFLSELSIPFEFCNDYTIPNFVDENTLVIITSYSGNTEETLMALEECIKRDSKIVVITSGGKLLEKAKKNNWLHYQIPPNEQPRAMLAFSLIQHMFILKSFKLIQTNFESDLIAIADLIDKEEENIKLEAKDIAFKMYDKMPIIYSDSNFESVAIRFRQQINENGKKLCWNATLPEMNHNELVGWAGGDNTMIALKINSDFEFYRTKKRWEFCKEQIAKKTSHIIEINSKGNSFVGQVFYQIHINDWISYFIAEKKKIDPTEVDIIIDLKSHLSELK